MVYIRFRSLGKRLYLGRIYASKFLIFAVFKFFGNLFQSLVSAGLEYGGGNGYGPYACVKYFVYMK